MDSGAKIIDYHDAERPDCCCMPLSQVYAAWRPTSRQIPAWCIDHKKSIKFLNLKTYGHNFGVTPSDGSGSQPSWYRIDEKTRFDVLERDGFACVWCTEPILKSEIDSVATSEILSDGAFITIEETATRTFFGHNADHLFTINEHDVLNGHVTKKVLDKIRREWIVTSCARCNRGHRERDILPSTMLSVYSRHLLMRSGEVDWADLEDFIGAMKLLRIRRARRPSTGTAG